MKIAVVVPTYNEAQNLPLLVKRLWGLGLDGLGVVVVDDNSPDGTGEVAEGLAREFPEKVVVVHRAKKGGLGPAYKAGFSHSLELGAEYIVQMDADLSHPVEAIPSFLDKLQEWDVVVGSRYAVGGRLDPRWGWGRRLLSWWGNFYARQVTGLRIRDATSGFKAFRRRVLEKLPLDRLASRGFIFQTELLCFCQRLGFRIAEIPITFAEREEGKSKMSLGIVWEALWRPWQMRWRR